MGFLSRLFGSRTVRTAPTATPDAPDSSSYRRSVIAHFQQFVETRVGVEAYLEPANVNEPTSLLLIATTGEWTRRRVPTPADGYKVAQELRIPIYDVNFTGYPQRMRDWNSAQRSARKKSGL